MKNFNKEKCQQCGEIVKSETEMESHESECNMFFTYIFTQHFCKICNYSAETGYEIKEHLTVTHQIYGIEPRKKMTDT